MPETSELANTKKRKCGPRVKTGCITCRIRRVKCDEEKPACKRCTSTGRKCDGYVQLQPKTIEKASPVRSRKNSMIVSPLDMVSAMPFSMSESQRDRQLFHFYCVQSAFDLSVYLNSSFWHNIIMQYSEHHPVVRQAVIAFGASHIYALKLNDSTANADELAEDVEQSEQYHKAIRWLRKYIESTGNPDPQVILICCALFFSCENSRGQRQKALQHLENGLSIINAEHRKRLPPPAKFVDQSSAVQPLDDQPKQQDVTRDEIDKELIYVFSRLDCQATLCQDTRVPVLDLDDIPADSWLDRPFNSITDAQRALDHVHNKLAIFLTKASPHRQATLETMPSWVKIQKAELDYLCSTWEENMNKFIALQDAKIKHIIHSEPTVAPAGNSDWHTALQIQLLNLHHRCWSMLFRSSYPLDPTVFTMSPNPRAEEILDICDFLGPSLPLRPSATVDMSEADVAWKLISEIGVAAPLFVLATKCTDQSIRHRAIHSLERLRQHRNGIRDRLFLDKVMDGVRMQSQDALDVTAFDQLDIQESENHFPAEAEFRYVSPSSQGGSDSSFCSPPVIVEGGSNHEANVLLGWSKKSNIG